MLFEDLIEDIVGSTWNQGDCYRLAGSEAVWDGDNFVVQVSEATSFQAKKIIGACLKK